MDGYEATRRIKSSTRGQATVIVALTASAFDSDRHIILAEGCDDFVRKPFVEEDIGKVLEKHLSVAFDVEEPHQEAAAAGPRQPLRQSELPPGLKERLRKATLEADYLRLKELLDELRPTHPQTASALAPLVKSFDYESILAVLDPPGTEKT